MPNLLVTSPDPRDRRTGFQFKRFFVAHDRCAMKVNTDGIVLGCALEASSPVRILDVGAGSGLISLILAQRFPDASLTALEIDADAAEQAAENAQYSPFSDRIAVNCVDMMQFLPESPFDLIVSNPPYFAPDFATSSHARDVARLRVQSHLDWLLKMREWLSPTGQIALILPFDAAQSLLQTASQHAIFCQRALNIITKAGKAPQRMLLQFGLTPCEIAQQTLILREADNRYSAEFHSLTADFYLNA